MNFAIDAMFKEAELLKQQTPLGTPEVKDFDEFLILLNGIMTQAPEYTECPDSTGAEEPAGRAGRQCDRQCLRIRAVHRRFGSPSFSSGNNTTIQRAALHTGRIYNHGSCYHLACRSRWAIQDDAHGYECEAGTRNEGRRMRPLFTCDGTATGAHAAPCRNNQIAIPHSIWRGITGGQCGQDLVICANGSFVHGIIRDRSHREFWEIGTGLIRGLGVTGIDIPNGAIYPDENDSQFLSDPRCR